MTIFAPALGALWRQLEGYGIDPEPLFRAEGIDPEVMYDQGARVPTERMLRLSARAASLSVLMPKAASSPSRVGRK